MDKPYEHEEIVLINQDGLYLKLVEKFLTEHQCEVEMKKI
jgi:hypothetical protein